MRILVEPKEIGSNPPYLNAQSAAGRNSPQAEMPLMEAKKSEAAIKGMCLSAPVQGPSGELFYLGSLPVKRHEMRRQNGEPAEQEAAATLR
jgi:hypothetical protein